MNFKKILKKASLAACMLLVAAGSYAQTAVSSKSQECKQLLQGYFQALEMLDKNTEGKYKLLHFKVSTQVNQSKASSKTSLLDNDVNVKIIKGPGMLFYESNYIAVYSDKKDVFTVLYPRKIIVWSKPEMQLQNEELALIESIRTKLFENAVVSSCKEIEEDGKKLKLIELKVNNEVNVAQKGKIAKVTYFYNIKSNRVEKQVIAYAEGYLIKQQVITYLEENANYPHRSVKSAYARVFASQGKLQSNFKNFTIEDNRF
jgi:hypothetical protein